MKSKVIPDISSRPTEMKLERQMNASADQIYDAWTQHFDCWFAEPGECMMTPEVDKPYFFRTRKDWGSHPHHGRFVELEKNKLVVMTWQTQGGTNGYETVIRIELTPNDQGTLMRMTHSGFADEKSCQGHKDNWPAAFDFLEEGVKKLIRS
ncbi:MAG: SRPBCC domain-containing protein [Candidatus Obscuribacterales bacterium]|jgi:uncharacterized protein YndB with AHSA1/START domain|nr:SRPBCC domain-containing protein [Candidatus Obscuribacterales bacterium]